MQGQKHSRIAVAAVEDSVTTEGDVDDLEEETPVAETEANDGAAKVTDGLFYSCLPVLLLANCGNLRGDRIV